MNLNNVNYRRFFFLLMFLFPFLVKAQETTHVADSSQRPEIPKLGEIGVSYAIVPISGQGEKFNLQQTTFYFNIPVYKNFNTPHPSIFKVGGFYQGLFLSKKSILGSDNFHSFMLPLSYTYMFSPSTNITALASAGFASDFNAHLIAADILYTAAVRMGFHQTKDLKYGIGLAFSNSYSGKYLIPTADVDWTISNKWLLQALLPLSASLRYHLTPSQDLALTFVANPGEYRLNNDGIRKYIQLQQYSGGLLYDLKFGKSWKLNLLAAHSFFQKFRSYENKEKVTLDNFNGLKNRVVLYSNDTKAFLFQAGISYRF